MGLGQRRGCDWGISEAQGWAKSGRKDHFRMVEQYCISQGHRVGTLDLI